MGKDLVLVVGGAGYIGSHTVKELGRRGFDAVVLDNLSRGHRRAVSQATFVEGDLADLDLLARLFAEYDFTAVMHFSAFAYVGESLTAPAKYYRNNVVNTLGLLEAMLAAQVKNFIFSSSCAVYGEPLKVPIPENHPKSPVNPYGWTKLIVEQMAADLDRSHGLKSIALRYFNAAGADPDRELGEDHNPETHLIPLVLSVALNRKEYIEIFGDDYSTPDGSCIRDYIHVSDLAAAHVAALRLLLAEKRSDVFNLGTGSGYSVKQVIETARQVTGHAIPAKIAPRRAGDPAQLIAAGAKAQQALGWTPKIAKLEDIVASAWDWHRSHPHGYDDADD